MKADYNTIISDIGEVAREYDAICILGPTACGKTGFAVKLALEIEKALPGSKGEILSADSRQVYRGMDIGTGKDIEEYTIEFGGEGKTIPYHLIDIADPGEKYNIFLYQKDFSKAYISIRERGNIPIICGGSGLYIEAATMGYELADVKPDNELRQRLEQKSMEELIEMFTDLKRKNGSKPHNKTDFDTKKRVIRAIEIEDYTLKHKGAPDYSELELPQRIFYIGIDVPKETRVERIDRRLVARLESGMEKEVRGLIEKGVPAEDLIYYGLEYKYVTQYIIGGLQYDEMVEKLRIAIHRFAKRQMTWFRGMERKGVKINWIELPEGR